MELKSIFYKFGSNKSRMDNTRFTYLFVTSPLNVRTSE